MATISKEKLYQKLCELEEEALDKYMTYPTGSPEGYTWSAILNERSKLKLMIHDFPEEE